MTAPALGLSLLAFGGCGNDGDVARVAPPDNPDAVKAQLEASGKTAKTRATFQSTKQTGTSTVP
jgi:hypothetical protein